MIGRARARSDADLAALQAAALPGGDAGYWRRETAAEMARHEAALRDRAALVGAEIVGPAFVVWRHRSVPLTVIASVGEFDDGRAWLHVSVAHPLRLPSYGELIEVKERFIGHDRYAVMIFPPRQFHVSIHDNALHLWSCLDGHPLPEFSQGTGSI